MNYLKICPNWCLWIDKMCHPLNKGAWGDA
jgi:hypothetical protein